MNHVSETKPRRAPRRQRSIYQVHYLLKKREDPMMAKPLLPTMLDIQAYASQVAGHQRTEDTKYFGLLQCNNGTVLKPIIKDAQKREVDFYSILSTTTIKELQELRSLVPKYFGCKRFTYNGFEQEYIILEDLTQRMLEPCIMDVKIGRRTWGPLATEDKIRNEESKYKLCKEQYGFCIPGFQVYKVTTGKLHKYNKEYGKRLHGPAVVDAIRTYLNGVSTHLCRALLLQFLSSLWRIQQWAARQSRVRLCRSSLLLLYDAQRLRDCCATDRVMAERVNCRPATLPRRHSIHSRHSLPAGSNFSGQINASGPVYKKVQPVPLTSLAVAQTTFSTPPKINSPWTDALEKLDSNHSFEHNYEDKLSQIKINYRAMLDQLSCDSPTAKPCGTVRIIDFPHAVFNEEDERSVDENFKEGIDNFVKIFEDFLKETDDQII